VGEADPPIAHEQLECERRALDAERRAEELEQDLASLRDEVAAMEAARQQHEQQSELEGLLREAGAVDIEAASALVRGLMESEQLDAPQAVGRLKQDKAFLFASPRSPLSAMSALASGSGALDRAAHAACRSGDRRDLLQYLRLRRGA